MTVKLSDDESGKAWKTKGNCRKMVDKRLFIGKVVTRLGDLRGDLTENLQIVKMLQVPGTQATKTGEFDFDSTRKKLCFSRSSRQAKNRVKSPKLK
jgi:hypothetical protein